MASMAAHVEAMLAFQRAGQRRLRLRQQPAPARLRLRGQGRLRLSRLCAGLHSSALLRRHGPFRWVALSGDPEDIYVTDRIILELFPENEHLRRWITLAEERSRLPGAAGPHLLAEVRRARAGRPGVQRGGGRGPGQGADRHRSRSPGCGSVASPNRETEGMRDGSDAISDWPILNALINAVGGATWVSFHHGGGVGIGYSQHAGQVIVADGTAGSGPALAAGADDRSGDGRRPPCGRGLPRGSRLCEASGDQIPML